MWLYLCVAGLVAFLFVLFLFFTLDCSIALAFYDTFAKNKHRLKNKTAWVIGASTGIGEEIAYQLAELNCKLILTSTSEETLQKVKAECIKRSQNSLKEDDILVLALDIADFKKNDASFKKIVEKFGNIDILVANAARGYVAPAADNDFENIQQVFAVNYFSHLYITKLVLKHWLANQSKGQILVTSAVAAALDSFPYASQYTASKKMLNCFFRDVAMQHQTNGIYVTNCLPGPVETPFNEKIIKPKRTTKHFEVKKQPAARVAHLMLVSMTNRLAETWICHHPYLILCYIFDSGFSNYLMFWLIKHLNLARFVERILFD